jgi:LPXTG-motif cell wall-anchored protein
MTSSDGISWTTQTSAADNTWTYVTYANGLFVAVAQTGTGNRVMTSGSFTPTTDTTLAATGGNVEWVLFAGLIAGLAGSGFLAVSSRRRI